MLYVCSLSRLQQTTEETGAKSLVTLISGGTPVERPDSIAQENHLFLSFNDIVEPMEGLTPPAAEHVEELIAFGRNWDRAAPMVVHCWAGISRSTAGAYIIACARDPEADEEGLAASLRAASPSATPNARLVAFADEILGRDGRMFGSVGLCRQRGLGLATGQRIVKAAQRFAFRSLNDAKIGPDAGPYFIQPPGLYLFNEFGIGDVGPCHSDHAPIAAADTPQPPFTATLTVSRTRATATSSGPG